GLVGLDALGAGVDGGAHRGAHQHGLAPQLLGAVRRLGGTGGGASIETTEGIVPHRRGDDLGQGQREDEDENEESGGGGSGHPGGDGMAAGRHQGGSGPRRPAQQLGSQQHEGHAGSSHEKDGELSGELELRGYGTHGPYAVAPLGGGGMSRVLPPWLLKAVSAWSSDATGTTLR